jgi:Phospholipid-translocating ATPase N-terminal
MRPQLSVHVPDEDSPRRPDDADDESSHGRWGKYSPGALLEKTASFTAKLAKGTASTITNTPSHIRNVGERMKGRSSVEPTKRAAQDAQYRSATMVHQSELATEASAKFDAGQTRVIHFNPGGESYADAVHETNRVVTAKYNIVTFLPIFLFEMFSRVAYLYFLIQVRQQPCQGMPFLLQQSHADCTLSSCHY